MSGSLMSHRFPHVAIAKTQSHGNSLEFAAMAGILGLTKIVST